jgi:hypothetical protein
VIFLGDIGQPLVVDPSVRWAFAGGRNGLQGGALGEPLQLLPIGSFDQDQTLVAVLRS